MSIVSSFIAMALFVPFVGWGIYILRVQLVHHEELAPVARWVTLGGVLAFFLIELGVLRIWLGSNTVEYFISALGLILSATALYGHLFISVASQLVVDLIHPSHDISDEELRPDFSAAEALEEVGDYDGALSEYLVMARIFPADADPVLRVAEVYLRLEDHANGTKFLEKGLNRIDSPERAMRVTNRLFGIYKQELGKPEESRRVLNDFLDRFPGSEYSETVQSRLDRLEQKKDGPKPHKSVTGLLEPPPGDLLQ